MTDQWIKFINNNFGSLTLGGLGLCIVVVFYYIYRKTLSPHSETSDSTSILFIGAQLLLIVSLGIIVATLPKDSEVQLGFLVVIAVIALISLLFTVAAGFSRLQLTDGKQAMGLPEGSIRALIALILIMVFVIVSIYVFRLTGSGYDIPVEMKAKEFALLDKEVKQKVSWLEFMPLVGRNN